MRATPSKMDLRGFCAAPWTEGVLYNDGSLKACDRAESVLGNWIENGLASCWNNDNYQLFRQKILRGQFPETSCEYCFNNLTTRDLFFNLNLPFVCYKEKVEGYIGNKLDIFEALASTLRLNSRSDRSDKILINYFAYLHELKNTLSDTTDGLPDGLITSVEKLVVIGNIVRSFLEGDIRSTEVVPYRQVQLIQKCNARCIHCFGSYNGSTANGKGLDNEHIDEAFSSQNSMVKFFMNGSEFLFYPKWKEIAAILKRNDIKLSLSTNSILLNKDTIRYLIDNGLISHLNFSVDGANKNTVERIRRNVSFDNMIKRIKFVLRYAHEVEYSLTLSFSFVLSRLNYHEVSDFVYLIDRLRGIFSDRSSVKHNIGSCNIVIQGLEPFNDPQYIAFVKENHHSKIDKQELIDEFDKLNKASSETEIPVFVFYNHPIGDFVRDGYPFPPIWDTHKI